MKDFFTSIVYSIFTVLTYIKIVIATENLIMDVTNKVVIIVLLTSKTTVYRLSLIVHIRLFLFGLDSIMASFFL